VNVVYVVQARTNSSRLPAKVLLPIKGVPIVVLAAKRAANRGAKLIILTSKEKTDDYLCSILSDFKMKYFRGSLDNTLERFVSGLAGVEERTGVVRLTADNIMPDGKFIEEMVEEFCASKLNYLCSTGTTSGLPYGMSVEIMRLSSLREAFSNTADVSDCEHVTPYIRRKYGVRIYEKYGFLELSKSRCTIDDIDDYLYMAKIFTDIDDSITEDAFTIITKIGKDTGE